MRDLAAPGAGPAPPRLEPPEGGLAPTGTSPPEGRFVRLANIRWLPAIKPLPKHRLLSWSSDAPGAAEPHTENSYGAWGMVNQNSPTFGGSWPPAVQSPTYAQFQSPDGSFYTIQMKMRVSNRGGNVPKTVFA